MAETFNVVVEIPRGSKNKYEVVNEYHKAEIKHFFEQYKALEPGKEVLPGDYWTGVEAAEKEIVAARQRLADSEK